MDFGGLLSKEIERKRKSAKTKKNLKRPKPASEAEPEKIDAKPELVADEPTNSADSDPLLAISDEKLTQSLEALDKDFNSSTLKEQKLQTLEILVKQDRKDSQYLAFLQEEKEVPDLIDPNDPSSISDVKVYRRLCLQVRKFLKVSLNTWEVNVNSQFPPSLLQETKRDLVKLLYKLRSGKLQPIMVITLSTIVYDIQTEQFTNANESYMKLSIGNVAWPIGVRDVGIHARSADQKITGDNKDTVANIMQNEHTRRWIIAVKRLISWWEKRHQVESVT